MAENLQESMYQRLRRDLLDGRYSPGERLKLRDLAAAWGTSPMPVRAALQRLAAEGALEGEPQRSVRVPPMTRERFAQLLQVRLSLERLAAEEGARRIDAAGKAELADCVARMDDALQTRDAAAYLQANSRFHLALYHACANPLLLRLIESLWLQVGPVFNRLFVDAERWPRLNDAHRDCLDAVLCGDADAARDAIVADLAGVGAILMDLLAEVERDGTTRGSRRSRPHA
jgi:DNA-binding GntR family transcriptional regulator